jgi:hypothetical protein
VRGIAVDRLAPSRVSQVTNMASVLNEVRLEQYRKMWVDPQVAGDDMSVGYLSTPRVSHTIRLKAEASAAIQTAWSTFRTE